MSLTLGTQLEVRQYLPLLFSREQVVDQIHQTIIAYMQGLIHHSLPRSGRRSKLSPCSSSRRTDSHNKVSVPGGISCGSKPFSRIRSRTVLRVLDSIISTAAMFICTPGCRAMSRLDILSITRRNQLTRALLVRPAVQSRKASTN